MLCPAADGRLSSASTAGSTMDENASAAAFGSRRRVGVVHEFTPAEGDQRELPRCVRTCLPQPLIGSFGGGGSVVPVVKSITIGLEFEPM